MNLLSVHAARVLELSACDILGADEEQKRIELLTSSAAGVFASFARQRIDLEAWFALMKLGERAGVAAAIESMFEGEPVNATEGRPALHTALRGSSGASEIARDAQRQVAVARLRMNALAARLRGSDVSDVVNVGIGGSDLGPRLVIDALHDQGSARFRVHFLSNVDGHGLQRLLARLDPLRTAVVLVSKSFATEETLLNGSHMRNWLGGDHRLYAVSAAPQRVAEFGVNSDQVLPMWDWVGGRYSLWSAAGWCIQLALGDVCFEQLLAGAAVMDAHVRGAPLEQNLAVRHGLTTVWNRNGLGFDSFAVLPYDERLRLLPAYLQQLAMESLGKSVDVNGVPLQFPTAPVWWGSVGTDCQHSYMQALHQGADTVPVEFIGVSHPDHPYRANHDALLANLMAQAQALWTGHAGEDTHRRHPGIRPSTTILLDRLSPATLGALLALYEHSVFVQSRIWGINAFDQYGVELGKKIARSVVPAIRGDAPNGSLDAVTRALLSRIRARR